MRRVDPEAIRRTFDAESDAVLVFYVRTVERILKTPTGKADLSRLSELVFIQAYIAFEGLLADLFRAYINRDPAAFLSETNARIAQSIKDKFGQWHADRLSFSSYRHIASQEIPLLLDRTGRNLTFPSADALQQRAQAWLAPQFAQKFAALRHEDLLVINAAKAMRDFIAHRSAAARATMNAVLAAIPKSPPTAGLGRGNKRVLSLGTFLKAPLASRGRRVTIYMGLLRSIASRL